MDWTALAISIATLEVTGWPAFIGAILGSTVLTALVTHIFMRNKYREEARNLRAVAGKNRADAENIRASKDTEVINQYKSLLDDLRQMHVAKLEDMQKRLDKMEQRETQMMEQNTLILRQNTLILEDKRELLVHYKDLKSEMETVRKRMVSYEQALKKHNIPLPK